MATIRRYPVPSDSYDPNRPLNDLVREQLKHFVEAAQRLPPELRIEMPVPSPDDAAAVNKFVAAVTERLMSVKRAPLKLVRKRGRKATAPPIALAAQAEAPASPVSRPKPKTRSESKSRRSSK
jgi:hypothetical protein